jgi:AcrR family transcriptional regulator
MEASALAARRPGRPAAAGRPEVLATATDRFLRGHRIDVRSIAGQLGLSRATIYSWYGSRAGLVGEVLATAGEDVVRRAHRQSRGAGPRRLLNTLDRINRELASAPALRSFLEAERETALRTLTSGAGVVQPRMVEAIRTVIEAERERGAYDPPVDSSALAYAIVRLGEAFLYNDAVVGIRGDIERLLELDALLLGVSARRSR